MPLPRIDAVTPVVVPAVAEKQYPDLFISRLQMLRMAGHVLKLDVSLTPYNYDLGEFGPGEGEMMTVNDVFAEAVRAPLVGQVMGGIIQVTGLLLQERNLLKQIAAASEEDKPALEATLATVREALGIV